MNGMTLVIGGVGNLKTELLEYESFETKDIELRLYNYYFPGLFLVEDGFCSKK